MMILSSAAYSTDYAPDGARRTVAGRTCLFGRRLVPRALIRAAGIAGNLPAGRVLDVAKLVDVQRSEGLIGNIADLAGRGHHPNEGAASRRRVALGTLIRHDAHQHRSELLDERRTRLSCGMDID